MVKLGDLVMDAISGFSGIATGRSEYLYGCVRILVEPKETKDGRPIAGEWIDEQRLTSTPSAVSGGPTSAPSRASDAPR